VQTLAQVGSALALAAPSRLKAAQVETTGFWAVKTALRLRQILATGALPGGSRLAPNSAYTQRLKAKRSKDPRAGVRDGGLLGGLGGAIRAKSDREVEVYGSDGQGQNDLKASLLIHGQRHQRGSKTYRQPARDFVAHDEAVIDEAGEKLLDEVAGALGW